MAADASAQLHAIAGRLRATGNGEIKLAFVRDLRATAQPLVYAVRQAAYDQLPRSGGLAESQATQAIKVSVLTGARTAGVRIRTRTRASFQTDKGFVRHPVFGDRDDWKSQKLPRAAGWWTKTLAARTPFVAAVLTKRIERMSAQIQGF